MSRFSELMEELERKNEREAPTHTGSSWYEQRTRNASDVVYPTIDTRGVKPVQEGGDDFDILDALAAGTGRAMEHLGTGISEALRPEGMTPSEWKKYQSQLLRDATEYLQDTGNAMYERNHRQYEDNSVSYHLQNIFESVPESAAIMAGAMVAGAPVGGVLGSLVKGGVRGAEMLPGGLRMVENLYRAYNAATPAAKVARFVTPSSTRAFAAAELGAIPEAYIEQLEAEKRYVELAKQNGTYVPDQTELEAKDPGKNVFLGNIGVISAFNIPEYNMLFGKGGGLKSKVGRAILASLLEGSEEVGQELVSAHALGQPVDSRAIRDSFIAGAAMGGGLHVAGGGLGYAIDRIEGRPTDGELERLQEDYKKFRQEQSETESQLYGNFRNDTQEHIDKYGEAARQSYRDAVNESALRDMARSENVPDNVFDIIMRTADEVGVPRARLLAQAIAESNGNQDDISPVGAIGVMQLIPETAQALGVDPNNLEQNILGGALYLKQQYERFGDWTLAHAAYNAGPGTVEKYGGVPDWSETQEYVDRINGLVNGVPSGEKSGGERGNGYTGEGGAGEGNYWVRNDGVSFDGAQPQLMDAIDMLGKKFYDDTGVKLVTSAGTNGDHPSNGSAHGHDAGWKVDIVDAGANGVGLNADGALFNSDFTPTEYCRKFIEYGRSLGLGMNLEGVGTSNVHIDVALDGTQWDGNGEDAGGFSPRNVQARADEIYTSKKRSLDASKPRWSDYVNQQTQSTTSKPTPEPARQISLRDAILYDGFAKSRLAKAVENGDADEALFWGKMFNDDDTFINTKANRGAILNRYGADELSQFASTLSQEQPQQAQPTQPQQGTPQPKAQTQPTQQISAGKTRTSSLLRGDGNVIEAGRSFLEELQNTGKREDLVTALKLQSALQNGDTATVENILKENGRPTTIQQQQQQPQSDPVKGNATPENVLRQGQPQGTVQPAEQKQPKPKLTDREKAEQTLQKPATSNKTPKKRRDLGNAVLFIADQEGVAIPEADRKSLQSGKTTVINKWRDHFISSGYITLQDGTSAKPAQSSAQSPTIPQEPPKTLAQRAREIVQAATDAARENWNDIKQEYRERGARARMPRQATDIDSALARRPSSKRIGQRAEINREVYDPTVANLAERDRTDNIPEWRGRTRDDNTTLRKRLQGEIDDSIQRRRQRRATAFINQLPEQERGALVGTQDIQNTDDTVGNVKQQLNELETQAKNQEARRQEEQQQLDSYTTFINQLPEQERGVTRGENNPESESYHVQTRDEIRTEQEQARKARESEQQRYVSYSDDESRPERGVTRGVNNPESESYHVQTRDEIQAEQEANRQRKQAEQDRYALDDSGAEQTSPTTVDSFNALDDDGNIDFQAIQKSIRRQKQQQKESGNAPSKVITPPKSNVYGNTAEVVSDNKQQPYQTRYRVVEADELTASHAMDGDNVFPNENYPEELQPRDRNRVEMSAQTVRMANTLSPADLMESRNLNQGAPVIRNDGVVLNGNGRTMAIRRAYEMGKGEEYKNAIVQNAEKLGLDADSVSKMRRPILVRELPQDLTGEDTREIASSTAGGARFGASEQAKTDAAKLSRYTLDLFPEDEVADLTKVQSRDFLKAAISDIANANERNALTDASGNVSQDGINRVARALFARAYDDDGLIARMSESTDDNVRGVSNALLTAAPEIAKVQKSMEAGVLYDYDLKAIPAAVKKLSALRDEGKPVATFLKEQSLFDSKSDTPEAKEILSFFDSKKFAPNKIAAFLREIAKGIRKQGNPKQGSLFGGKEPKPLLEIIKQAADNVENGGQADMFAETGQAQKQEVTPEEAAARYNESNDKKSMEGGADTRIINLVDDKDLTTPQKLLKDFAAKLGAPIQFFNNPDGRFHGAFSDGITFLNVNSKKGLGGVFWHEAFHWLKANNPKLYAKLVDAAGITQEQRDAFLKRTKRKDLTTNEEIDEEILADQMDDIAKRTGLLQSIAGKNRGVIERVVQWLKDTLNKFIETFRNPQGRLTTAQAKNLTAEFVKMARQLKDADGNAIFRVNNRTGDVEVIGSRKPVTARPSQIIAAAQKQGGNIKYSVDTNDNSNESFGQRIKNFTRAVFGNKPPTRTHQQIITDALSKLARHKIYYGYNGKTQGDVVVDSHQRAIFARHGYDFEKLLPIVGKQIAANLKLPDTAEMSNYIADWMATGALNNTSPEAKAFAKAMRDNPAEAELLQSVRDSFKALANMTPEEKYDSLIARGEESKSDNGDFMENFIDDLNPIKKLEEQLVSDEKDPAVAKLIKDTLAPYLHARLSKGKGAISDMMIGKRGAKYTKAILDNLRDVLQQQYLGVDFSDFKPMAAIIQDAGGDAKGLERYALAKLDKEMYEKLREVDKNGNPKYPPGSFTPSASEADVDAVIKAGDAKFSKAHAELVNYSNTLAAIQYTSGLITANQFYSMVNGWKNYVPTARVFDEDTPFTIDFNAADSTKQKTGSKRRIISPLEKIAANTEVFLRQAEQNKVKLQVAQMVRFGGFGDVIAETPKGDSRGNTVRFRENGVMKYLVTPDKSIARALDAIRTPADSNVVMQAFKTAGLVMRGLYTMWNTDFAVGNPFRDMPDAFIHNKYGSRNPFVVIPAMVRASIDGFAQSVGLKTQSKEFQEFLAYGGTQSGFSYELTEGSSNRVKDIAGNTSKGRRVWNSFINLMEASENMTRFATYKTALDGLVAKHGGKATAQDKRLAALQARSASVDFARAGKSMRSVNKVFLFSNAAVQSLALWGEKIYNAAKNKEGARKELFTALWKTFLGGIVPAIVASAFNYSDDDRRERYKQLQNWEKDNYWNFATDIDLSFIPFMSEHTAIRIPKGMDIFLRASSAMTEEFASYLAENKPVEWKRIMTLFRNGLPSVTTTIVTPLIETWTNYSLFKDAAIVPYGEQDLPAYKQYGKNTSWFAKWLGDKLDYSPRKIDHLIAGYGGSQATWLTGGGDGLPILRRFLFDPDKNPRIVQDYYKALEEQEGMFAEYKQRRKDGEKVDLPEEYDRKLHARLKAAQEPMRNISRMEKKVADSEKLDDDQKKTRLRELEKKRVALCERIFKRAQ